MGSSIALRVEEIDFYGQKENCLFHNGKGSLRFHGWDLSLLESLEQCPGMMWLLVGERSRAPGKPSDRLRMSDLEVSTAAAREKFFSSREWQLSLLRLPDDLIQFLDAGHQLEYDPEKCEAGRVRLKHRSELTLRTFGACLGGTGSPHEGEDPHPGPGVYLVPGVDLIASCTEDYQPEGLLVWLPDEKSFGTWDPCHDHLLSFGEDVRWSDIARSPDRFINAQWPSFYDEFERAPAEYVVPWPKYPHQ